MEKKWLRKEKKCQCILMTRLGRSDWRWMLLKNERVVSHSGSLENQPIRLQHVCIQSLWATGLWCCSDDTSTALINSSESSTAAAQRATVAARSPPFIAVPAAPVCSAGTERLRYQKFSLWSLFIKWWVSGPPAQRRQGERKVETWPPTLPEETWQCKLSLSCRSLILERGLGEILVFLFFLF